MKKYKVWVEIEEVEITDKNEDCHNVCEPECLGEFDTFEEAEEFVADLPQV